MILKISVYSIIQFVYLIIVLVMRPFEFVKDYLLDLVNETIYLVLCLMLIYWNKSERWNSVVENTYICIIIANNLFIITVAFMSWIKRKKKFKKSSVQSKDIASNKEIVKLEKVSFSIPIFNLINI